MTTVGTMIHRESHYKHQLPRAPEDGTTLPCVRDPQLFSSARADEVLAAKYLCGTCPIRRQCLDGALTRCEPVGVWGGEVFKQGRIERPKPRRAAA